MKIKDIILVIDNYKGIERNFLCTFEGFVKNHITNACDNFYEVAEMVKELDATRGKFNEYCEMYFASNKTMYAKYCSSISELQIFLLGKLNHETEVSFEERFCDKECLKTMERMGIHVSGAQLDDKYPHYEKLEKTFEQGEVLHNFNGCDYRVMEKLSENNLLLMDIVSGNFTVGIGVDYFARYPKGENIKSDLCEKAIEWVHGVYLGSTPSEIDFQAIRREYGQDRQVMESQDKPIMYQVEIEERLARVVDIKADSMEEALDKAREQYYDEKIVLDAEDMKSVEFKEYGCKELQKEKSR